MVVSAFFFPLCPLFELMQPIFVLHYFVPLLKENFDRANVA